MLAEFVGILLIFVVALLVAGLLGGVHKLLGPRREFPEKQEPFECGEHQIVSPQPALLGEVLSGRDAVRLFDLEAVFFYPWGALFRELGWFGFVAMTIFTVPLVVGLLYEWRKGGARMVSAVRSAGGAPSERDARRDRARDREVPA